jgi:hypothetical protein
MKYSRFFLLLFVFALSPALKAQESNFRILFLADDEGTLRPYTMLPDGTDIELLIDSEFEEGGKITYVSLSPDGRTLAVSSNNYRPEIDPAYNADEIFLLDMETGVITQLTDDALNNTEPKWSPDSQHLAYLTGNGMNGYDTLHVFDTVSQATAVVATYTDFASVVIDNLVPIFRNFDWSPDGQKIVLSGQVGLPEGYNILLLINADGTEARQVTSHEISSGPSVAWGAEPNIIYTRCSDFYSDSPDEICQLNLETLEFAPITQLRSVLPEDSSPNIYGLDVNPDGQIAFVYGLGGREDDLSSIYLLHPTDYNAPTLIAEIASYRHFIGWVELPE